MRTLTNLVFLCPSSFKSAPTLEPKAIRLHDLFVQSCRIPFPIHTFHLSQMPCEIFQTCQPSSIAVIGPNHSSFLQSQSLFLFSIRLKQGCSAFLCMNPKNHYIKHCWCTSNLLKVHYVYSNVLETLVIRCLQLTYKYLHSYFLIFPHAK